MRPWYKKKRFILPGALLALIVLFIAIGQVGGDPLTTRPGTSAVPSDAATEEPTEEPTEGPTEGPTKEPIEEPTAKAPKPISYSGRGSDVVKFKKPVTDPILVTTTWSGPEDNNTIYAVDKDGNEGDLLVNTIGSYEGTTLINIHDGDSVAALKVEGSGRWKVTLKPLTAAKRWDGSKTLSGRGDDVIYVGDVFDGLDSLSFKSTRAEGNITVYALGDSEDLLVNEIGNFSGKYLVPDGVSFLHISSDGRWAMRKV
jgi:hypothetical protein